MIEIIACTLEDALNIEKYGGERIELVSALSEGGLTPSYALIERVIKEVEIPVNVMIRPHSNSFMYSSEELEIMKKDILIAKKLKANGVVLGVLNNKNEIHEEALNFLLEACDCMEVTFHKAIDEVPDIINAVKILDKYPQIKNILSSGGRGNITDNIDIIKCMIENCGHIDILVGGGLKFTNIEEIVDRTGAASYHFGTAVRKNASIRETIDGEKLEKMVEIIKNKKII